LMLEMWTGCVDAELTPDSVNEKNVFRL